MPQGEVRQQDGWIPKKNHIQVEDINMRTLHRFFLIALALFPLLGSGPITKTAQATVPAAEKKALVDLSNATDGANWTHNDGWNNPNKPDPCDNHWYGISCNSTNGHVTKLDLHDNNLTGTIPSTIGNLILLQVLDLDYNHLAGVIPHGISNQTNLQLLDLDSNNLTGTIPFSIGNLINLQTLDLYTNHLSGNIPASIGNLAQLNNLFLGGNNLSGSVPSSIGNLINLQALDLDSNCLSGTIPSSLSALIHLQRLFLYNNYFSGRIPSSLCSLTQMQRLLLDNNRLCGRVPGSLTNLVNLWNNIGLRLDHNRLITEANSPLEAFIVQKSSGYSNWQTTQDSQSCFSWPMFLPAIVRP